MFKQKKRRESSREKLVYLMQYLRNLLGAISYTILDPVKEYEEGTIVFTGQPRLPFLVFKIDDIYGGVCIAEFSNVKLESITTIRINKYYPLVKVEVLVGENRGYVYYNSLVEGLAYLFLPSILNEYRKGNIEIDGNPGFRDFLDIVMEYGESVSSDPRSAKIGFEELFNRTYVSRFLVLKQYPGIDFMFAGIGYDDYYRDMFLVTCNSNFEIIFSAYIGGTGKEGQDISYRLIKDLPVFKEVTELAKTRAYRIIDEYKAIIRKAYFGVKIYAI